MNSVHIRVASGQFGIGTPRYAVSGTRDPLTISVEPVTGEEHREEKNDVWVIPQGNPESEDFSLPRGILRLRDVRAV